MTKNELYKMHRWPHTGNKQRAKNRARNPEGQEFPKGYRPWEPREAP
jgi:hypothetical protein